VSHAGFAPAGASLGGDACGSSIQSSSSAPLFRTLFTTRLTGHNRSTLSCFPSAMARHS